MCSDLLTKCKTGTPLVHSRNHMLGITYEEAVAIHSNPQVITVNVVMMNIPNELSDLTDLESDAMEDDQDGEPPEGVMVNEDVGDVESSPSIHSQGDVDSVVSYLENYEDSDLEGDRSLAQPNVGRLVPNWLLTHANGTYTYRSEVEYPHIHPTPIAPVNHNPYEQDLIHLDGVFPIMGPNHRHEIIRPYQYQESLFNRQFDPNPLYNQIVAQGPYQVNGPSVWNTRDRSRYWTPPNVQGHLANEEAYRRYLSDLVGNILLQVIYYRLHRFQRVPTYPIIWLPSRVTQGPPPDYLFRMLGRRIQNHEVDNMNPELIRQIVDMFMLQPYTPSSSFPLMENTVWYFWFCLQESYVISRQPPRFYTFPDQPFPLTASHHHSDETWRQRNRIDFFLYHSRWIHELSMEPQWSQLLLYPRRRHIYEDINTSAPEMLEFVDGSVHVQSYNHSFIIVEVSIVIF